TPSQGFFDQPPDQPIQRRPVAQHAVAQPSGERTITRAGQRSQQRQERDIERAAPVDDRQNRLRRELARGGPIGLYRPLLGRIHDAARRALNQSRADTGRLPGACSSRISSTPCPQPTASTSGALSGRIVPGGASPAAGRARWMRQFWPSTSAKATGQG